MDVNVDEPRRHDQTGRVDFDRAPLFSQIADWTPAEVAWFEAEMQGFKGRVERDKWIEQCRKLATGWRPENEAGERPKG